MKKLFCVLLCLAVAVLLSACGLKNLKEVELPPFPKVTEVIVTPKPTATPTPPPETPEPTPEVIPEAPEEAAPEELLGLEGEVTVRYKHTEYEQYDPEEGTQRILIFSYDSPYVTIVGNPEATSNINGQLAFMDESFYVGGNEGDGLGFNGLLEMAEDNYAYVRQSGNNELSLEYSSTRSVRPERIDQDMISFVFSYTDFTGGAHGNYSDVGCVFDAKTGELLRLEDLSSDYEKLETRLVHELVSLTSSDKSLYEHVYISYMNNDYHGTLRKLLRPGAWYFDEDGMVFFSSLYELGPFSAGIAVFHIPYSKIDDVLDSRWLPESRQDGGTVNVMAMDSISEGSTSFMDRIEADQKGSEFCVIAQGTVYDVRLSRVYYADKFYDKEQLWFCSEMKDSAVQILAKIPEGIPDLMLSYTDAEGKSFHKLISLDENGSFQLVNRKDVVPVG